MCVKHDIQSGANLAVHSKDCRRVSKPPSERPCEGTCDNLLWKYAQWSEVSFEIHPGRCYNVDILLKIL